MGSFWVFGFDWNWPERVDPLQMARTSHVGHLNLKRECGCFDESFTNLGAKFDGIDPTSGSGDGRQ